MAPKLKTLRALAERGPVFVEVRRADGPCWGRVVALPEASRRGARLRVDLTGIVVEIALAEVTRVAPR